MSNLKWTITYCRLFVWTLFQHPGNLISSADFTSFEFFLEFWPIFSCFATKYFALYMKMSKKFQKSADFLEFCRQCPRIFCPLLGTVRYWELLLNKNGREAEFCPLLGAFPLLGSALLGAFSVFHIHIRGRQFKKVLLLKTFFNRFWPKSNWSTKHFLFDLNLELHSGLKVGGSEINFII